MTRRVVCFREETTSSAAAAAGAPQTCGHGCARPPGGCAPGSCTARRPPSVLYLGNEVAMCSSPHGAGVFAPRPSGLKVHEIIRNSSAQIRLLPPIYFCLLIGLVVHSSTSVWTQQHMFYTLDYDPIPLYLFCCRIVDPLIIGPLAGSDPLTFLCQGPSFFTSSPSSLSGTTTHRTVRVHLAWFLPWSDHLTPAPGGWHRKPRSECQLRLPLLGCLCS